MKKSDSRNMRRLDRYIGCFGNYGPEDPICRQGCALRIRCAIDQEQNVRMELIEDLMGSNDLPLKLQ
jgi:hypothetical protein